MRKKLFITIFITILFLFCSCSNNDNSKNMSINKALEISSNYLDKYFDIKIENTSNEKLEIIKNENHINYNFSFLDNNSNKNYHILFNDNPDYTNFSIYYDNLLQNKTISYKKALNVANKFIEKKFSDKNIKMLKNDFISKETKAYEYNFFYTRMHNKIPYNDNGVNITIDASSNITYLSLDWDNNISFPDKNISLNKDDINKLFFDKLKLNLSYMNLKNSLIPVYEINYDYGIYLDASTKNIINPYNTLDNIVSYNVDIDDLKNNSIFEIKNKQNKNDKLVYDFVNIVKDEFIPKDYKFSYKDDYKNYKNQNITNYSYSNNKNLASISFNHSTNEVENIFIPFKRNYDDKNSSNKEKYNDNKENKENNLNKKEYSYKKALYYISLIENDKLDSINLNAYNYSPNNKTTDDTIYYFNFIRTINNIAYNSNSIYIGINSITGQLQSYSLIWDDIYNMKEIKNDIKNLKTRKDIKKIFLKDASYIPVYLKIDGDVIIAYKLVLNNNSLINAITGNFIK